MKYVASNTLDVNSGAIHLIGYLKGVSYFQLSFYDNKTS